VLNRTWRPTLSVTGVEGMPSLQNAGNVLRPYTSFKLSVRLPPGVDPASATAAVKKALERDPPYGARVSFEAEKGGPGWDAPPFAPWLEASMRAASETFFGRPRCPWARAGPSPSWGCWGRSFRRRSS
jgi:acetylornithine deacetylase/succinyl-diaminopimelate desuccinylase-like protein